jgi:MarC family membrane protein
MLEFVFNSFVTLLVVVDTQGLAPIFAALTRGYSEKRKREAAIRGTVLGTVILLVFALAGDVLLEALGISIPAFRIAGGILLFLLALDMIFASPSGLRSRPCANKRRIPTSTTSPCSRSPSRCSQVPARSRPSSTTPANGVPRSWQCS